MKQSRFRPQLTLPNDVLIGRRVELRPLRPDDFKHWSEVRNANVDWLTKWEPTRPAGTPDVINDKNAFASRCNARDRERHLGSGYGFGIFVNGSFSGEINISSIQRGPFQNCYVGYWIDQRKAGNSYTPESLVLLLQFAFEELKLHRVQVAIIPRNVSSRRVVEKLELRNEGLAQKYLEIDGQWEDHMRFAITSEEWIERAPDLVTEWID
jgi:ribosomal-protein-alanine N-acetyltransferase